MDMRHGGLVLRDMNNAAGTAEFIAEKKRMQSEVGKRLPRGMSNAEEASEVPQAIVISAAGAAGANGIYRATAREECGAPVYEHAAAGAVFKICRSATASKKTGRAKHGWLLSEKGAPLYGVPTESVAVPPSGWKAFGGAEPLPEVKVHPRLAGAFFDEADDAKGLGDAAMTREEWQAAQEHFAAGLEALDRSGDRFGEPFESRAAGLLAARADCLVQLGEHRQAVRDAIAALELVPGCRAAAAAAAEGARADGWDEASVRGLLDEQVGNGRILDRGAPLALRVVEKWIDSFAPQGGQRAPYARSSDYRQQNEAWTDSDRTRQVY
mmetsp:Transcript_30974/g.92147  ORF Transcript_30974/g.92147 Transcript_30974/m.92147 type:complete len:325 (-) Transcript_30974:54-1028(-)